MDVFAFGTGRRRRPKTSSIARSVFPPKVEMLSGENHRERVLSVKEEQRYLSSASAQTYLLRDVATVLLDCALRPDECFRMRWEDVRDGALHIHYGKTENARPTIPMTQRIAAHLDIR